MKYVGVNHDGCDKTYWFKVPNMLADYVALGKKAVCDTRHGATFGTIVGIVDGLDDDGVRRAINHSLPTKWIVGIETEVEMARLHIPWDMISSNPAPEKIAMRMSEFYATGRFDTSITFTPDNDLTDGYTAYLVAKMFDHETLQGIYICDREKG